MLDNLQDEKEESHSCEEERITRDFEENDSHNK